MARERELRVRIIGDSDSAERAFKRTADAADKIGPSGKVAQQALDNVSSAVSSRLGPAAGVADDALKKMGSSAIASGSALSLGLAGGAAVAGAGLTAFAVQGVASFLSLAEEVRNFQRVSGASTEDASRFVAVLDDLKIESEAGATALFRLGREVAAGAPKLEKYGVEVARNADGTANLTETLLNVADAYAAAPTQAQKTAIAFAAFGKQAQALLPLLEKGRAGLRGFFDGAEEHGQILSQEDLDQARELELAIDDLQDSMRGLQIIGAKALIPFLTTLSDVGSKATSIVGTIEQKTGGILSSVGAGAVKNFFGPIGAAFDLVSGSGDKAAKSTRDVGEAAAGAAPLADQMADATQDVAAAQREAASEAREHEAALRRLLAASESLIGTQLSVADAVDRLRDSQADSAAKEKALSDAVKEHGRGSDQAKRAAEELEDQRRSELRDIDSLARARRDLAVQQAESAGQTLTDADKYRIYRDELIKLKDAMAPGSPLRVHLEELINQLPPPEVKFAVLADTEQAEGALEALRQKLGVLNALASVDDVEEQGDISGAVRFFTQPASRSRGSYHDGGPITGDHDEVPIVAQKGEFVVRRSAADKIGRPTLDRLNRMHTGGPVGQLANAGPGGFDYDRLAAAIAAATPPQQYSHRVENHFGPIHGLTLAEIEREADRRASLAALNGDGG